MTNPHLDAGRRSHGAQLADATLVVVAVHGRGQSPAYLVENLIERLDLADRAIAWILPAAHGNVWYPASFMAPLADNEPWLGYSLNALAAVEREVRQPIVWAGFSQGGSLVAAHVARARERVPAGLICLTGALIGPPSKTQRVVGPVTGMPAYFSNSDNDEWVPLASTEAAVDAYRTAGADVEFELLPGRAHVISDAEIAAADKLLRRIVG